MSIISKQKAKHLVVGRYHDQAESDPFDDDVLINLQAKRLLRHVMALGSSGSGKTVFCKVVVEEMLRLKIPCICIDPQGDLCSLALGVQEQDEETLIQQGIDPTLAQQFMQQTDAVIFTPASRVAVPLCADPFYSNIDLLKGQDRLQAISNVASMLVSLLGYDIASDDGEGLVAAFDHKLTQLADQSNYPRSLDQFSKVLENMGEEGETELSRYIDQRKLKACLRKLARLDVGARRLLFHEGLPLNIDLLLGKGDHSCAQKGKTRLSVIYLNSLHNAEDKEFFIATLAEQLYTWMLQNPRKTAQALFYIDEVAPFIPPVRKPACKSALTLIFKQARKYGVSCLMATQNPGDVDYKAMSQFATWAIGRLSTRQDIKKVYPTVKSIDSKHADQIMDALPSLQAGEFMLLSPDHFDHGVHMKTRWLYTPHETLDERRIEALCDEHWRERFLALEQKMKHRTQEGAKDHESTAAQANSDAGSSQNTDAQTDQTTNLVEDSDTKSTAKSSSKLSSKPSKKSSKKSSTRTSKTPSHDANNDTTHDESSSKDQMTNHDQQSILAYLTSHDTCDVKTIAHELSVSENKARTVLKNLEKNKKIKSYKMGRSVHYFSLTAGGRPDLDLAREVKSFIPKLSESQMLNIAEENRAKSFLGLIGSEEKFLEKTLCYHVLYQVAFSEIVSAGIFSFFSNDKQVEDYIYIEPETLKILVYQPDKPIELVDKPAEHASEIKDFDGVADIKMIAPADVRFNIDAWKARQPIDVVKNSIQKRFQLNISHVEPIFLPLWALRYQIQGSHQVRVIRVDALTGKQIIL